MTTYGERRNQVDPFDIHTPQALVSITIAATSTTLYSVTVGNTAKITKIFAIARGAASSILRIGRTSAGFVQIFPDIFLPAGITVILSEDDLPGYWFREYNDSATDIIGQASVAAVAPNDVQVFVEVIEKGLG